MALSAGTVSVDDDGTATGSGLALALYNAKVGGLRAAFLADVKWVPYRRVVADEAALEAAAIVSHFQANGVAVATANSLASGVPSSPVLLPIL